jgi:hypothetical protein
MKKYSDLVKPLPLLAIDKNALLFTPKTISYTLCAKQAWNQRINNVLSSPSCQNFESYTRGVETQLRVAKLEQSDLIQIRTAVKEAQSAKATYRMYTVSKGSIKVKDAKQGIDEKNTQRKPKKQVQVDTKLTITVDNKDNKVGEVSDQVINPNSGDLHLRIKYKIHF